MYLFIIQFGKFFIRRIFKIIILLIAVITVSFILISYSPIDPVQAYIGADMNIVSEAQRQAISSYWGLSDSKWEQFQKWFSTIISGDLGTSVIYRQDVLDIIKERFLASILLMGLAWILSGLCGFFLGIYAAMKEETLIDNIIKNYCFIFASTPSFWVGILLLICLSVWLPIFPIGLGTPMGVELHDVTILDRVKHLVLPVLTLTIVGIPQIALHTRSKLIDILKSPHIRFANAQGKDGMPLILTHAVRNISLPAISIHFASFGELFGGAILVEQVFSYPGLGATIVQAGLQSDVPLLLGIVIFSTIFVFIGNSIADLLYVIIDPQMRGSELK